MYEEDVKGDVDLVGWEKCVFKCGVEFFGVVVFLELKLCGRIGYVFVEKGDGFECVDVEVIEFGLLVVE